MKDVWLPVIAVIAASLPPIVLAAALYIRTLLAEQTAQLKAHITVATTAPPARPIPPPPTVTTIQPLGTVIPPGSGTEG